MKGTLKYVRRAVYAAVALGLVVVSIVEVNAAGVTVRAALTALAGVFLAYSAVSGALRLIPGRGARPETSVVGFTAPAETITVLMLRRG